MDYKITVIVRDVTRGDIAVIEDWLGSIGPDFDADRGDFDVAVYQSMDDGVHWFFAGDAGDEGDD